MCRCRRSRPTWRRAVTRRSRRACSASRTSGRRTASWSRMRSKGKWSWSCEPSFRSEVEMFKRGAGVLWRRWAPLPLRLVIGYGFIAHGWAKLNRGPTEFARLLDQIGAPLPELTAWVSTLIEILGGVAILAGAFVAVVSVPLIVMMLVAMFTVHLRYGFSAINTIGLTTDGPQFGPPGYEVNLLYIAGLLALMLGGAGALSIDRLLRPRNWPPTRTQEIS